MSTVAKRPFDWDKMEKELQAAIDQARAISKQGNDQQAAAAAWDVVEEIQAEMSHQRQDHPAKNHFEEYCDDYPDALESRMYDV
jgi:hypothetical protein